MTDKKKSTVNKAGNYTKPTMRKNLFNKIKAGSKGGKPGQWSARKAQMLAKEYKARCLTVKYIPISLILKQVKGFMTLKTFQKQQRKRLKNNGAKRISEVS
jgi:hypothetical protein